MTRERQAINVSDIPAVREIAEEVARTRRPKLLRVDGEDVAVIVPSESPARQPRRGKPITADDPLWNIIGMAENETATDVSVNHDAYLADWELSTRR